MVIRPRTTHPVRATLVWPLLCCCLAAMPAAAQQTAPPDTPAPADVQAQAGPAPANLTFVDGGVDVTHDGITERADAPFLLLDGDVVRTANGRAEIVFGDGSLLHVDHDTEIELLSPTRLRLIGGRVLVRVSPAATTAYTIDAQAGSVRLDPRGEYGLSADAQYGRLELRVARGVAELDDNSERVTVRGGEMAKVLGPGGRPVLMSYNSARWDTFDRWSASRANGFSTADSSRRVPYELRPYGPVLDMYGRWDYVEPYGNVWFPAVGADWRPYYAGSWNDTRYGLTWIGHDPWAWPTHHYGRWGFSGASWYWIPASVWAPAWVSWGYAPGFVSWCPLGWNGQPVLGFWNRPGKPTYDPWKAWTIMPRDKFGFGGGGGRRATRVNAIDPGTLPDATKRMMVVQNIPPGRSPSHAVPRGTFSMPTATRSPGTVDGAARRDVIDAPRQGSVRRPGQVPRAESADTTGTTAAPSAKSKPERTPPVAYQPPAYQAPAYQPPAYQPPPATADKIERRGTTEQRTREEAPRYSPPPRYTAPEQSRSRESTPPPPRGKESGTSGSPRQSSPPPAHAPKMEGKSSAPASSGGGSAAGGKRKGGA